MRSKARARAPRPPGIGPLGRDPPRPRTQGRAFSIGFSPGWRATGIHIIGRDVDPRNARPPDPPGGGRRLLCLGELSGPQGPIPFFLSFFLCACRPAPDPPRLCQFGHARCSEERVVCRDDASAETRHRPRPAQCTRPHATPPRKKKGGKKERERTHAPCRGTCRPPCTSGCQTAPDRTGSSRSRSPRPCRKS